MPGIAPEMMGSIPAWLSTLGIGTGLFTWLKFLIEKRKLMLAEGAQGASIEKLNFEIILSEMRKQRDEAWGKVTEHANRIQQLEVEINGLRIARDLDPFPHWIVTTSDFSYIYVNREFERIFLAPVGKSFRDIIGKRHKDLWPAEFCRKLYTLNEAAKTRPDGTARATTELEIPLLGPASVTVHKFPVKTQPSGVIVGWAGYITGVDPLERKVG